MKTVLQCTDLELRIGFKPLLSQIHLTLNAGEKTALTGPNGTGKTSLLRVLAGISQPYSGQLYVFDECIYPHKSVKSEHLACYLASAPALLLDHPVDGNLEFMCNSFGYSPTWEEINKAKERLGLEGRGNQVVRTLSTGQKRRLTLAALLVLKPKFVLADEPSNGLDTEGTGLCLDVFEDLRLNHETTFLIASHDERVISWCSKIIPISSFFPQKNRKTSTIRSL